MTKRICWRSRY